MNSQESPPPPPPPTCPACGARRPADAPGGNCPACLWALASAPEEDGAPEAAASSKTAPVRFGSYKLIEEIARGGMGVVWRARQDGLGREVALKMIVSGRLATSAQVLRFYTEARAAARLDHPNIVPIFEIGEDEGCHFYSMRLMEGPSLTRALGAGGGFTPPRSARMVATIARAVHFAHQRGVLHRDVKPSNILLDAEGEPHVVDFGLARIAEEDSGASRTDAVLGTPAYMAPEQASGPSRQVTTAADVYGLGAVLYELLTHRPPFEAETPLQTLRLVTESEPIRPRALDARIDRRLEVICLKCLEKQPEKRYPSAAALADDLERWLAGETILARPASRLERIVSWARRRPELAFSLGALSVVLALALAVSLAFFLRVRSALRSEEAQRLAFQSLAVVKENPGQALLLALESAARDTSLSSNNALLSALEACREQRRFLGHTEGVNSVGFSPDGERVVTASNDGTARIWSVAGGPPLEVLKGHTGSVLAASFAPDGQRVVTAGGDVTARLWDAGSGRQIAVLPGEGPSINGAVFSPDGEQVVTLSGSTARTWNARTGQAIHVLKAHGADVLCAAFDPRGGQLVTGSEDKTAIIWDLGAGTALRRLTGHSAAIFDVSYSADGKRIATGSDPDARVWDATTGGEVCALNGHAFAVYSVAFGPDGDFLATGSEDFTARIWAVPGGRQLHVLPHSHKVIHLEASRDGALLLTASYDRLARVWDLRTGALLAEMKGNAAPLNHAAFSPDSRRIATACADCTARLWGIDPGRPLLSPARGDGVFFAADLSPDGRSMVTARLGSGTATVVDLDSRRELTHLEGREGRIMSLSYSSDGSKVLGGYDDATGCLWDARTGRLLHSLAGHSAGIYACSFSADGNLAMTVSHDLTARVWDAHTGEPAAMLPCARMILSAAFTPDGRRVVLADSGWDVRIVDLSSGENFPLPRDRLGFVRAVDFGREGRTIVTVSETTRAHVRSLPDCKVMATLVHPARVTYAVFSPDKRWIATGATDSTLRIWDAVTLEKWLEIKNEGHFGARARFSQDGSRVMVSWVPDGVHDAKDLQMGIYPLDVLAAARKASFGDLTPDERDHFQVGSPAERRAHREAWRGGHIYGPEGGAGR
jgi:WD40 repeat protein